MILAYDNVFLSFFLLASAMHKIPQSQTSAELPYCTPTIQSSYQTFCVDAGGQFMLTVNCALTSALAGPMYCSVNTILIYLLNSIPSWFCLKMKQSAVTTKQIHF